MILIADLVEGKLTVPITNHIILVVIDQHIMGMGGLVIVADDVCGKDAIGRLEVAIAVIKANDFDVVEFFHKSHFLRFAVSNEVVGYRVHTSKEHHLLREGLFLPLHPDDDRICKKREKHPTSQNQKT